VLFETLTANWGAGARWFVLVTLVSEAMLLFVAAQAGFLDGPAYFPTWHGPLDADEIRHAQRPPRYAEWHPAHGHRRVS